MPKNIPSYSDLGLNFRFESWSLGTILTLAIRFSFVFAGFGLLIYLIFGGFKLLTGGSNPENIEKGKKIITNALIGFLIIISTYWLTQILETVFGLQITN